MLVDDDRIGHFRRIEMGSFWLWEKDQKMQTPQCRYLVNNRVFDFHHHYDHYQEHHTITIKMKILILYIFNSPRSLRHGASQKRLRGHAGCLIKIKILNEHLHQQRSGGDYYIFRMFKSMDCTNLKETSQKMIVDTFAPKRW